MTLPEIARMRWRMAKKLSLIVIGVYFGFILLIAFNKPAMGYLLMPGLSVGILLGAAVIVISWLSTLFYVVWANTRYENALRNRHTGGQV